MDKTKKIVKVYTLEEADNVLFGERGTPERDGFERRKAKEIELFKIAQTLKEIRKQKGLTQEELGKAIGVKKPQISKLESGNSNITLDTIYRLSEGLGVEVKFVINENTQPDYGSASAMLS